MTGLFSISIHWLPFLSFPSLPFLSIRGSSFSIHRVPVLWPPLNSSSFHWIPFLPFSTGFFFRPFRWDPVSFFGIISFNLASFSFHGIFSFLSSYFLSFSPRSSFFSISFSFCELLSFLFCQSLFHLASLLSSPSLPFTSSPSLYVCSLSFLFLSAGFFYSSPNLHRALGADKAYLVFEVSPPSYWH